MHSRVDISVIKWRLSAASVEPSVQFDHEDLIWDHPDQQTEILPRIAYRLAGFGTSDAPAHNSSRADRFDEVGTLGVRLYSKPTMPTNTGQRNQTIRHRRDAHER